MEEASSRPPTYTLRRVASIVVALLSLLPLLLFAYTLYALDALRQPMVQLTLGLALGLSLVGYYIFWVMIARLSALLRVAGTTPPTESGIASAPSPASAGAGFEIPGMGQVGEVHAFLEPIEQLGTVWRREAEPHVGRRVLVSVMNAPEPIPGTLMQVTEDGLLLDQDGRRVGITYRRISAIEAERVAAH